MQVSIGIVCSRVQRAPSENFQQCKCTRNKYEQHGFWQKRCFSFHHNSHIISGYTTAYRVVLQIQIKHISFSFYISRTVSFKILNRGCATSMLEWDHNLSSVLKGGLHRTSHFLTRCMKKNYIWIWTKYVRKCKIPALDRFNFWSYIFQCMYKRPAVQSQASNKITTDCIFFFP